MEFTGLILPLTKNICRTCLQESDTEISLKMQDLVDHDTVKVKLIDILVFLNCLENNDEDNWPHVMCTSCVSNAVAAYNFKLNCLKANATLSQIFSIQSSPTHLHRSDMDSIDINVVYQDHEYELPLFSGQPSLDFESSLTTDKELAPLPPVTEITSTEQPPRKEGEKKYACTICFKLFTRIHGLHYHMAKHTDFRRYLCSKCGKRFITPNGLTQHLITHKETAPYKCGFCNKNYKSHQCLKSHFRKAHSSNRHSYSCAICAKRFTAKSTLNTHMKSHSGENQFACPHCPKTYTRASYLKAHSYVHTDQGKPKPITCTYTGCDRRFVTKHSLEIHVAHTHKSERPHKCDFCFKGFPTKAGLRVHLKSHKKNSVDELKTEINLEPTDMILETVVDNVFYDQVYYDYDIMAG